MTDKPKKPDKPEMQYAIVPYISFPLYKKDTAKERHLSIFSRISIILATPERHKSDTKK
jgi:hypothetical protein